MPLSNIFQTRSSKKKALKVTKSSSTEENESPKNESFSSDPGHTETTLAQCPLLEKKSSADTEINDGRFDHHNIDSSSVVSEILVSANPNSKVDSSDVNPESLDSSLRNSLPTETEENAMNNYYESNTSSDGSQQDLRSGNMVPKKVSRSTPRSASIQENTSSYITKTGRRRKCISESEPEVLNISTDEDDMILQFRKKDLENVIGRYVDKLIRESVENAVKRCSVDNFYENIVNTLSDGTHASGSEQLEEKQYRVDHAFSIGISEGEVEKDEELISDDGKNNSMDGYHADCEESLSIHSLPSEYSSDKLRNSDSACFKSARYVVTAQEKHEVIPKKFQHSGQTISVSKCSDDNAENKPFTEKVESPTSQSETSDPMTIPSAESESANSTAIPVAECQSTDPVRIPATGDKSSDLMMITATKGESGDPMTISESESKSEDLMLLSEDDRCHLLAVTDCGPSDIVQDLGENLPEQNSQEDEKKKNWKVGYLHVKLPHKTRSKGHLKVWKKRCVAIQPDEFVNDPNNPCLMISVYSAESGHARKHSALFWKSVACQNAVVYRSNSRTHKYAFTVSDDNKAVVHLAADSESASQEWMSAIRSVLWPPSPVVQLEKMLSGNEYEMSVIDNEFSYRAGLLGMYGYLSITPRKLILIHPQQGYVIQEWYLNTVDKFQLVHQTRIEDVHKVLAMTTCSDSSTGRGEILIYCREAVALLQSLASTIHQVLSHHSIQEGGKYKKELEEMAGWLVTESTDDSSMSEDYYKVPPRQVKSLLDIPNFIFEKPLTPVASAVCTTEKMVEPLLETLKASPATASKDSGISTGMDDFLNCSVTSFVVGGGPFPGKSSDSDLSDTYTPPQTPESKKRSTIAKKEAVSDHPQIVITKKA